MWLVLHGVCATAACCVYALVNHNYKTYLAQSKRACALLQLVYSAQDSPAMTYVVCMGNLSSMSAAAHSSMQLHGRKRVRERECTAKTKSPELLTKNHRLIVLHCRKCIVQHDNNTHSHTHTHTLVQALSLGPARNKCTQNEFAA